MRPVPAATMRRITFIHTTLARLLHADDVRDLFLQDDPFERLWQALRDVGCARCPTASPATARWTSRCGRARLLGHQL
ncbi:MAG: hypothetical protein R2854_27525 [Caldilineaceae bacterium]